MFSAVWTDKRLDEILKSLSLSDSCELLKIRQGLAQQKLYPDIALLTARSGVGQTEHLLNQNRQNLTCLLNYLD